MKGIIWKKLESSYESLKIILTFIQYIYIYTTMPSLEIDWRHLETWVTPLIMQSFFWKPEEDVSWSLFWARKCSERVHELFFHTKEDFIHFIRMKTHEYIMATLLVQKIKGDNPKSHVSWRFSTLETDVHRGRDIFLIEKKIGIPVDLTTNPEKPTHKPVVIASLNREIVREISRNLWKQSFSSEQEFDIWMNQYKSFTESIRITRFWETITTKNLFPKKATKRKKDF